MIKESKILGDIKDLEGENNKLKGILDMIKKYQELKIRNNDLRFKINKLLKEVQL